MLGQLHSKPEAFGAAEKKLEKQKGKQGSSQGVGGAWEEEKEEGDGESLSESLLRLLSDQELLAPS